MGRIMLSKEAAARAITYSNEAKDQLLNNVTIMDNNVNSQFSALQDPAFKRYFELSERMQSLLRQIGGKMDDISKYCESVMRWIDAYNEN